MPKALHVYTINGPFIDTRVFMILMVYLDKESGIEIWMVLNIFYTL